MSKPKLYLFVGYPGAGKTTVAKLIATATGGIHLWADQERQVMFGKAKLNSQETIVLYDKLNAYTEKLLSEGMSVIFDTNFNYAKDRASLRELATKLDADTVLIWITTPIEIARKRAVEDSQGQDGRIWGNMSIEDFDRISSHLEPPTADEKPIRFDGSKLDIEQVKQTLNLA